MKLPLTWSMKAWFIAAGLSGLLLSLVPVLATFSFAADETPPSNGKTPLGVKQRHVERMVEDLERKFKDLSIKLYKTEQERSERISKTLEESKQLLVHQRISELVKLLDEARLDTAVESQQQVLTDIRKLLALLLNEQNEREKAREEYERLEAWKKEIKDILKEERPQKAESERLANKDQTLADLAAQIKAVEALIQKQTEANGIAAAAKGQGVQALDKAAGKQNEVKQQTEKVADMIAGKEAAKALEKPAEGKSGEGKSGEGKASEGKPGEGKSGEGKAGEGKSGEGKSGEGKSGEGKSGEQDQKPPAPGEKSLREAVKNQENAEKNLGQAKAKAGQEDQERALSDLNKALAELKKEQSRIASLPPEEFKKLADKQSDTAKKTGDLQEQMQKQAQAGGGGGGGDSKGGDSKGGGGDSKPQPGQKSVQKAQKSMDNASGDLQKQDPTEAARNQDKAIKDLEKAMQEIEDRLAQLREETQLEKLAKLEARFREMLARHQASMASTKEAETKRQKLDELKQEDPLAPRKWATEVAVISAEERAIAEAAQQAFLIIFEDGTSVVFPEIVSQLRNDLMAVGDLLDAKNTEQYTQSLQTEVETTLKELIEALQKAQKQKEGGGGGGGGSGGSGDEPLLPNSAELKLLRFSQLRINRRTESFHKNRPAGEVQPVIKQEVQNISQRQAEIAEMTQRILDRLEQ